MKAKMRDAASLLARMTWWFFCGLAGSRATGTFSEWVFLLLAGLAGVGYWLQSIRHVRELADAARDGRLGGINEAVGVCRSVLAERTALERDDGRRHRDSEIAGVTLCVHDLVVYRREVERRSGVAP